jgi:predicted esterase
MKPIRVVWLLLAVGACGKDDPGTGTQIDSGTMMTVDAKTTGGHGDISMGCKLAPPMGAKLAAAPKPYAGTCPTIPKATTQDVVIMSSGAMRKFWIVVPTNFDMTEELPVIFLWHWLGGSAQDFFDRGAVQVAVDEQRFIAVIPQAKGDLQFTWPATNLDSQARLEEDAKFFDDMLSCVSAQFTVDANCVSSVGVSAGALWTAQLVGARGDWLSSFMSLSGGVGGQAIKPWKAPAHKMPGFVLWGGSTDSCGSGLLNFGAISQTLEMSMIMGGHFLVECVHNCGHSVPPFEAPMGSSTFKSLWQFGLDHPFWLDPGESPYMNSGLPADMPPWCGKGMGGATPRTGVCVDASEC